MPGTNLSRAEAAERASLVATESYRVTLDLTGESETIFPSVTEIDFSATPGASTFIDLIAESVERIVLNGQELPTSLFADSRIALNDLAEHNTLRVESTMNYSRTGEGLHRYVDPADGEVYLYSQFEVADARRVFACFEQPDLKADFTFTVTAPASWRVFSNSPSPAPELVGDGVARWSFTPTERISTYLTSIVAGPYDGVDGAVYQSTDGREIPLGVWARKSLVEYLDAEEIFTITRQGFEFYEANYGHPYPFRKYDQIFCPEYNAGAMEHPGNVTIVESYVFRTKPTAAMVDRRAITILHEQAHMWFGDLVTMKWWDDLWLNESFAEYMSHLAAVGNTRWSDAWITFLASEKTWALAQDQLPSTHPIAANIRDIEDVLVNFDGITYGKGASVLKQLVAWVGQEEFLAGVRSYIAKNAWGNATLQDLLSELEVASGRDLSSWTKLWLEEAGPNTLSPSITERDGVVSELSIVQTGNGPASLRPHRIGVAGFDLVEGKLVRTLTTQLDIDGELTPVPDFAGQPRPALILLNDGDHAYGKIRLDEQSLNTAVEHLDAFDDHLARSIVFFSAWDMCRDAEIAATDFLQIALKAVRDETDGTVLRLALNNIVTATNLYSAPAHREALRLDVANTMFEILQQAAPGSDHQLQIAAAAGRLAVTDEQLDLIAGWLDGVNVPEGYDVDAEVRWTILVALAAAGRIGEAEIAAEYERDTTSYGQIYSAQARGALPDAAVREAVWSDITGHEVSNTVQRNLCLGSARAKAESLVPYAQRYFADAEAQWDNHTVETASNMLEYAFPLQLTGRTDLGVDLVALGDAWLAEHSESTAPACVRLVSEVVDAAHRALRAQQVDAAGA
ncbi:MULTISPECIES: aminopeptidase N [unclassified Actinobaculum]|uniref:aminopeptidase N n=1 Tax=unclassified Actinobaculum TaxID=2609299 RepID=UPI000D529C5B|nr:MULTISPECIES: aminopeptidase N [unclassified Actinobaculum]AWE42756.1 aminopeptidase N [Actinobaculum sp. 313]RTE49571.1 aminopeptidase N [Actinobaculum sp. 352]